MDKRIRLYCIPFAGGSAMAYYKWKKNLNACIELYPVELSGRGRRMNSPLYNDFHEAVEDIYNMIKSDLDDKPYAIFGHSMGSYLAFELYYKIMEFNNKNPKHIFFSGRFPPNYNLNEENTHWLPDDEFIQEVFKLGGMSEEVLNDRSLLKVFLPILKSDYKLVETYNYKEKKTKLNCDISILTGKQDEITNKANSNGWSEHTDHKCHFYEFEGGHFFIDSCQNEVVNIINDTLVEFI